MKAVDGLVVGGIVGVAATLVFGTLTELVLLAGLAGVAAWRWNRITSLRGRSPKENS